MFRNAISRTTAWVLKWIDANISMGSILGRAKRRGLEKKEQILEEKQKDPSFTLSNNEKQILLDTRTELYSIKELVDNLPVGRSPNYYWDKLIEVLQKLGRQRETFQLGKYYTFKYWAKTRGKYFDLHPVSIIVRKSAYTVLGVNLHWKNAPQFVESMYRTYDYSCFQSKFYEIKEWELEYVMRIPTFYPIKR